jgi:fermentation-respiration switch protein FrsA (DUF1100 family)
MNVSRSSVKLRMIAIALIGLLGTAVLLVLLIWWQQERIVFQPSGPPFPDAATAQRVEYRASDGQPLFALLVRPDHQPPVGVLIAFHGNADLAAWRVPWAEELARRSGWLVMLAEYRGYGGLPGVPTVAGARLDARAAAAWARDSLGVDRPMALYGHSLGSAVAAELAAELPVSRLLLESPFTSAREMARIVIARPIAWTWGLISRVHYDTRARVGSLDIPVSVAHGDQDFVIPVRMGRAVFGAARVPGALLIVAGAGHNDVSDLGGERYWSWLLSALPALRGDTLAPPR